MLKLIDNQPNRQIDQNWCADAEKSGQYEANAPDIYINASPVCEPRAHTH